MESGEHDLPPLKSLVAFEATIRLGSMTAAAGELGTTQPAISQRIRALEESLGCVLFERNGKLLRATYEGQQIYEGLASPVSEIKAAIKRMRRHFNKQKPTIAIAANFGFSYFWLMPKLPALQAQFPQIQFKIRPVNRDDEPLLQDADIAIQFGTLEGDFRFEQLLIPETVFPVCSPALAKELGFEPGDHLTSIENLPLLHKDNDDSRWLDWRHWCQQAGIETPDDAPIFCFNNYPLLLGAAEDGQGVALGWTGLIEKQISEGKLIALGPVVTRPHRGYIVRSNYHETYLVRDILKWIISQPISNLTQGSPGLLGGIKNVR